MRYNLVYISILAISIGLFACADEQSSSTKSMENLPQATGRSGDILVVMEDNWWNAAPGDSLLGEIRQNYPGLPQPEPLFGTVRVAPNKFSSLLRSQRNIIYVLTDSADFGKDHFTSSADTYFKTLRNVYAKGQLMVITNPFLSKHALADSFGTSGHLISKIFQEEEDFRNNQFLSRVTDKDIITQLKNDFGIILPVPEDYRVGKSTKNFIWLISEQNEKIFNITVHKKPYEGPEDFSTKNIIALRNAMGKKHIPGSFEGSHLSTEQRYDPIVDTISVDGHYTILTRGLWRMEGDFMGGPFVNMAIYDDANRMAYYVDGFVFAPKFKKRELIRSVERIMRAFQTVKNPKSVK